jgi:arsenate reductase
LLEHNLELEERDLVKQPLTEEELDQLIGDRPVAEFFNLRSPSAKQLGIQKVPPREEALRLMAQTPHLIRRPLLVSEDRVLIGFDPSAYAEVVRM